MYKRLFEKTEKRTSNEDVSKQNLLLLSGSRAAGNLPEHVKPKYLGFAKEWINEFFAEAIIDGKPILFVPYARPDGMPEEEYFEFVKQEVSNMNKDIQLICAPSKGITEKTLQNIGGIYVGGGHTYTLLDKLQKTGSLQIIRQKVEQGLPYLGSSAGTLITCPTIKTGNDMPCLSADFIDLRSLGLIKTQVNCHYMDNSMHDPKHQGETRDERLQEFCAFNPNIPVIGLYEGTALRVRGSNIHILISEQARGNKPPVFCNGERTEIVCEIGKSKDISEFLDVKKQESELTLN